MKRQIAWLCLVGSLTISMTAYAGPAVSLGVVINPCTGICPSRPDFFALEVGEVVPLSVYALDAAGQVDTGYSGTVAFSSTDPVATVPATYTFTAADQGFHLFPASTTFRTTGLQTVSATDAANAIGGGASVTILPVPIPVPASTPTGRLALLGLLAVAGGRLISRR
jgi:hypothetical protein